ncbi:ribosome biogenesis GTPase Der [Dokdonella immobilis]|uniref:GTPase Der n=1 Tax=Dokdonella immobilis TaxID=578942 RepID=A0A1I4V2B0_9GAMM|nr:ribosome biogenesis GTPase Der [Dokdonella immobilis]SFM95359.1 GTP-binding protein [Dokdonella immobilis]
MLPVVALVGRPNVGKSTLFNVLTRTRDALVADMPGVTRDRHYGFCRLGERHFVLVDTGGLADSDEGLAGLTARQVELAIAEADVVVFVVDARDGLLPTDQAILERLRRTSKPMLLAVNKLDGLDESVALADFARLGVANPMPLAASHGHGTLQLVKAIETLLPAGEPETPSGADEGGVRVAIVGRPNVGKSTLVNRLLGEDRVIVSNVAGTTRDSIRIPLERDGRKYTLIDTAGVRRRARIDDAVEKFSVIKTLQSIDAANVVVMLLDANEGVTDQDAGLIGHALEAGRALVIAINKWDGLKTYDRDQCKRSLERKLTFVEWAPRLTISALHGTGIGELMKRVNRVHAAANAKLTASDLTRALETAYAAFQPPLVRGHAPKLRYAHPGGTNPPTIVIHGSRTKHLAESYRRYLENFFRKRYKLEGTPIRIDFREGENPYATRKNVQADGQQRRRPRAPGKAPRGKK